jgi:UDP-N-acetylmuramoylalanine--D-glutamate ligase
MKRALILGLGESGIAMARWLAREGWMLRVADTRAAPPMLPTLQAELPQAQFPGGPWDADLLEGVDLVALSPGLSPLQEPLRALLAQAAQRGIDVVGEIELFARALERLREERGYVTRVLGVTGTNGKTTTVRMVARMLEQGGRSVCTAGNISPSALDALRGLLDADRLPDFWVLELSSFQLATTSSLACAAAAILNITQDHLDWHGSFADYRASKLRIFAPSTYRVFNRDDPATQDLMSAPVLPGSGPSEAAAASFGAGAPKQLGQFGLAREAGLLWLACTDEAPPRSRNLRARRGRGGRDPAAVGLLGPAPLEEGELPAVHRLMPIDALPVRGTHNAMNALAALALVRAVGAPLAPALRALEGFRGEPHRTETVACVAGVEYVDDSKGTNVGATVAALQGLAAGAVAADLGADAAGAPAAARRIVVILGGDGKGQAFEPLAEAVRAHARAALLIGKDAPLIAQALEGIDVPLLFPADLRAAVQAAAVLAQSGDVVLLSPACASLDAFRNYAHRAEVFRAAVAELSTGQSTERSAALPGSGSGGVAPGADAASTPAPGKGEA